MRGNEPYIPLEQCIHGITYKLHSRNLRIGVYDKQTKGFVGIRTKFGFRYLFTEYHWDTGAPFGTACPLAAIENCPFTDLSEANTDLFSYLDRLLNNVTPED